MAWFDFAIRAGDYVRSKKPRRRMRDGYVLTGRSSRQEPDKWGLDVYSNLFGIEKLDYDLPHKEIFSYLDLLSLYNPDFSQAVSNYELLANPGHRVQVEMPPLAEQSRESGLKKQNKTKLQVKQKIETLASSVNKRGGGIDGVIGALLRQYGTFGAMVGEWIPNEDLDDIVDMVLLDPKSIVFKFNKEKQIYELWQRVAMGNKQELIRLNENTVFYLCYMSNKGKPYGIPPFMSSLYNIAIQTKMMDSLKSYVKKQGMLGLIDISIAPLVQEYDENATAYETRCKDYLTTWKNVYEDMVSTGGLIHYNDGEISISAVEGKTAAGVEKIFQLDEEQVFSGLKSLPALQGRTYSTTETYAGVSYDIMLRFAATPQKLVKRAIEKGYKLACILWGYDEGVRPKLKFNRNKAMERFRDSQAEVNEQSVALLDWANGIIDQNRYAELRGYDSVVEVKDKPEVIDPKGYASDSMRQDDHDERDDTSSRDTQE